MDAGGLDALLPADVAVEDSEPLAAVGGAGAASCYLGSLIQVEEASAYI